MRPLLLLMAALTTASCSMQMPPAVDNDVIKADRDFSALSQQEGTKKAFLTYMDSNAVMLNDNHMPIAGNDLALHFTATNDTNVILTWKPLNGSVAKSGDFGYTYGVYTLKFKTGDTTVHQGTYTTIWKKQNSGKWKFVLDTGNEGLGK